MSGKSSGKYTGNEADSVRPPFSELPKAVSDVFQPNMRCADFSVYAVLARRNNWTTNPDNSVRELAIAANVSPATALRSVEMLVHLGLIERTRRGGSQADEYTLTDVRGAAKKWNATYDRRSVSYSLSPEDRKRLRESVKALGTKQRGAGRESSMPLGVSPVKRQRFPKKRQRTHGETQAGPHLIQEEGRKEEGPTPTPSQNGGDPEGAKDRPDEDGPEPDLRAIRAQFTGVINEWGDAMLDTGRTPTPHLINGVADWERLGVNSWAVEAAARRSNELVLTLCADDPAAAERGLVKYRKRWDAAWLKYFSGKVEVQWVKAARRR